MSVAPRRLGKYELQRCLGRGGMAEVWKALDTQLQRYVAIKLLHADLQNDPSFISRFLREGRVIASLHYPNIVKVHDFQVSRPPESESTIAYMVMDYVEGPTLDDYIRSTSEAGKFPSPNEIVRLFTSISLAIDYAHQHGMVHRDLKPANILLDAHNTSINSMGEPILTDFGLAKMLGTSTGAMSGAWLSTPLYVSPEQAQGYAGNERSDLYSLGIILYQICTGRLPFNGESAADVMVQHINTPPPPPATINRNISPALAVVILRAIAKDPAARFSSASSMAAALAEAFNLPVPESLGQPAYPVNSLEGPTERRSLPLDRRAGGPPSSPSMPSVGSSPPAPAVTLAAPAMVASSNPGIPVPVTPPVPVQPISRPHPAVSPVESIATIQAGRSSPGFLSAPIPAQRKRRKKLFITLIMLAILILLGSIGTALYLVYQGNSQASQVVGHVFFLSSGQISKDSNQGINDEVQINLTSISAPAAGKHYYTWLVGDKNKVQQTAIFLAALTVNHGAAGALYKDPQQRNLLASSCCFLITQQDDASIPDKPSLDRSTWLYYGEMPQIPGPNHFTVLAHLRHLLADDPTISALGLYGGLDPWLFRNTGRVLEWAISARDDWKTKSTALMHDHFVRILDYLDGLSYVQQDLPPGTPTLGDPNIASIARVPLLEVANPNQNPPGYLNHITRHLQYLIQTPGVTMDQLKIANQTMADLKQVASWLEQVRKDATQLVSETNDQLLLPATLSVLDEMQTQAFYAYIGRLNPSTNDVEPGVTQIYYNILRLGTIDVTPYASS